MDEKRKRPEPEQKAIPIITGVIASSKTLSQKYPVSTFCGTKALGEASSTYYAERSQIS